ncbi:MAG: glycosyltransferase family 2 protein, partial [Clostridia bacterium]|nr:glycosyltransferase family 2 protein [Clostridia bacterium]
MQPFVSIIIPVYNEEIYVVNAVNSILQQPCKDLEIILINDGSTDKSEQVCRDLSLEDERIVFINKSNTGVSDTRNIGIEKARGKYIAFLDSDDQWNKDSFTERTKQEIEYSKSEVIAFAQYESGKNINEPTLLIKATPLPEIINGDDIVDCIFTHFCSLFYSRQLLERCNIRFDTSLRYFEDSVFKRKILYLSKSCHIISDDNAPLFTYRVNPHSVCHTSKESEFIKAVYKAFILLQDFFESQYIIEGRDPNHYNAQQGLQFV